MPVGVPPVTSMPDMQLPLTPTPRTGVDKDEPAVVTGSIVGVKHEQTTTPGATTRIVLVPVLQHSETGSAVGVTFLTGEPVGVVETVYV